MTTEEYLSGLDVSMKSANEFIMNNLDNLELVYNTCKQFGINNDMIADIVNLNITGETVSNYFDNNKLNGSELNFDSLNIGLGFSLFALKKADDCIYTFSEYDSSNQSLTAVDQHDHKIIYNINDGNIIKETHYDEEGELSYVLNLSYNSKNQRETEELISFNESNSNPMIKNFSWSDDQVTFESISTYEINEQVFETIYVGTGNSLNSTGTDALIWYEDYNNDGLTDLVTYNRFDDNGNLIKHEFEIQNGLNQDEVIENICTFEWVLLV